MTTERKKIAVVTGAGSGIGRAVAVALSAEGWTVVLAGRREALLKETAAMCTNNGNLVVPTDINNPDSVKDLFRRTMSAFGRLDLLFNNAGVSSPAKPFEELTLEEWRLVIDTNLTGAFLCSQEAVRIMKNQQPMGGRIINNGSISAHAPRPNSAPYTASKHAMTGLTRSLSLDFRAFNIAVGQIDIGNAETDMTRKVHGGVPQADGSVRAEPTMDVTHVGRTVAHIASMPPEANVPFITVMANGMPYIGRG